MRKQKRIVIGVMLMGLLFQTFPSIPHAYAQVSAEYKPNYKFAAERDKIEETNRTINAKQKNGQTVEVYHFRDLLKNYNTLFQYLPQTSEYKSVYEDCRILTESLAKQYDPNEYTQYYNNCLAPLNEIFKEIANSNTVKAKISAKPTDGSAPLTVTFDGRGSSDDASKTTIPSKNYFWYYTDTNGVEQSIGNAPVVKHTFSKEGNYVVHLTVRSANAMAEGVFDGSADVNVNVGPQAAKLIIFANGRRLKEEIAIKFTSQEAADGIRIDGTATAPLGGRQIMKHEWTIVNSSDEIIYKEGSLDSRGRNNGAPGSFKFPLNSNGVYSVSLRIQDNENNIVESTYDIIIADPIATIRVSPVDGNTTSVYTFDASTSYSVQSTLKAYNWVITDTDGNEVITENEKSFQHKFLLPGTYRVRLRVSDQQGNDNEEVITLQVDSTPPVPQFTFEPTRQRQKPSEYTFDATPTYDVDTKNGDALTYEWGFSNSDNIAIDKTYDDNKRIVVTFREKGKYKVTLTVRDNYGKIEQITKDVDILSTLRPKFSVRPASVKLGENINFTLRSNKNISNYKIDYGDGKIENSTREQYSYRYKKVGMFVIKVTAFSDDGEENTITTNVFIGDADKPIPAYSVTNQKSEIVLPEWTCTDPNGDKSPAYVVERYQDVVVDGGESLNTQGAKSNLIFYFKPQTEDTFKGQQKRHKFDEVGCQFIDFTIEDTTANKTANTRIWFFVTNARPSVSNVIMSFPQISNNYGVGIGQNANKEQFSEEIDPLVVKIEAIKPEDKDGSVSKFKWYYYNVDDPQRLLEIKYTPGNTPYTYFTIPRIYGEYRFGVQIFDNDGESSDSESTLGKGPVVFFPPDSKNPDIPIVTLKIDKGNAKVGENITLEAIAKITSNRNDFSTNSTYSYDFDGDGNWDLVTKDNKVTWVYKNTGTYTPRAKVTYRGRSGIAEGEKTTIQKGVKAGYLYAVIGNTLVVRDTSYGEITSRRFCLDRALCHNSEKGIIDVSSFFTKQYDKPGKYYPRYDIKDKYGNSSSAAQVQINIGDPIPKDSIGIVTLPAADKDGKVFIGKILENKVLFYVGYNGGGDCYIDTDITKSGNGGSTTDQDRDLACNLDALISYEPTVGSTIARIYYQAGDNLTSKDVSINFLDYEVELSIEQSTLYNSIDNIINQLQDNAPALKSMLLQLRNTIAEGDDTSSLVLQLKDYLENNSETVSSSIQGQIYNILDTLENETTCSANGCNEYKTSRTAITSLFRTERKEEISKLFEEIDNAKTPADKKQLLDKILEIGNEEFSNKHLEQGDIDALNAEICNIVIYFDIVGTSCRGEDEQLTGDVADLPDEGGSQSGVGRKILKVIGIIVGVLGLGFIILVIIFALKAKKKQEVVQ